MVAAADYQKKKKNSTRGRDVPWFHLKKLVPWLEPGLAQQTASLACSADQLHRESVGNGRCSRLPKSPRIGLKDESPSFRWEGGMFWWLPKTSLVLGIRLVITKRVLFWYWEDKWVICRRCSIATMIDAHNRSVRSYIKNQNVGRQISKARLHANVYICSLDCFTDLF